MKYIVKIAGHRIDAGDTVDVQGVNEQFRFKILEVRENSFGVRWLDGNKAGSLDSIPHSLFAPLGHKVVVTEVLDDEKNPNAVFKMRKVYE